MIGIVSLAAGAAVMYVAMRGRLKDAKAFYEENLRRITEEDSQRDEMLRTQFRTAASEALERNSRTFRENSAAQIDALLRPIKESLGRFDKSLNDTRLESVKYNAELRASIEMVLKRSSAVEEEASKLANAITGQVKFQGNFGEILLNRLLDSAGMQRGVHYDIQGRIRDAEGNAVKTGQGRELQPDVMVYYPDDTVVIVDSKVSLKAFDSYMNATGQAERDRFAKEHVKSVLAHVEEMSRKDYNSYLPKEKQLVDFNIMFMPVEAAFQLMMATDPLLWQNARSRGVLIVSQMNLLVFLQMIGMGWKQALQERHITEVYRMAEGIHSQLLGFLQNMDKLGDALDNADAAYANALKRLNGSSQSVVSKLKRLEEYGVKNSSLKGKGLPRRFAAGDSNAGDSNAGDGGSVTCC